MSPQPDILSSTFELLWYFLPLLWHLVCHMLQWFVYLYYILDKIVNTGQACCRHQYHFFLLKNSLKCFANSDNYWKSIDRYCSKCWKVDSQHNLCSIKKKKVAPLRRVYSSKIRLPQDVYELLFPMCRR